MEKSKRLKTVRGAFPEVEQIKDDALRLAVIDIWAMAWESSEWRSLEDCPKGVDVPVEHNLIMHSRAVASFAMSLCDQHNEYNGIGMNRDHVIAIALLHDVCKLHEFTRTESGHSKSRIGNLYQHGYLSAHWAQEAGLSDEIVHGLMSHTPLSGVIPQTQEAVLVHYADFADTDALLLEAGLPLFCKRK